MQKVDGAANSFQKKYGVIVGSIDKWHFDSCPWVNTADGDKDSVDPDVATMAIVDKIATDSSQATLSRIGLSGICFEGVPFAPFDFPPCFC